MAHESSDRSDPGLQYWLDRHRTPRPTRTVVHHERFLTFELCGGRFNNQRLLLEHAAILAMALNRTLVIPPPRAENLDTIVGMGHWFALEDMNHGPLRVVSFLTFSRMVGLQGDRFERISELPGTLVDSGPKGVVYCVPDCAQYPRSCTEPDPFVHKMQSASDPAVAGARILHLVGHHFYVYTWASRTWRRRLER